MLTGPPEAPCVAKWLMFGISIPSMKNAFSEGPPPLTIRSLRYPIGENDTPGYDLTILAMSLFAPGILSISPMLMIFMLTGLSMLLRNGDGLTVDAEISARFSFISISMAGV